MFGILTPSLEMGLLYYWGSFIFGTLLFTLKKRIESRFEKLNIKSRRCPRLWSEYKLIFYI